MVFKFKRKVTITLESNDSKRLGHIAYNMYYWPYPLENKPTQKDYVKITKVME